MANSSPEGAEFVAIQISERRLKVKYCITYFKPLVKRRKRIAKDITLFIYIYMTIPLNEKIH